MNYKGGPIKLKDFDGAVKKLEAVSGDIILMCGCADVNVCHRKIVAEQLAKLWHCEVEHLARPVRKPTPDGQAKLFQE